jgi:hypothetical protein
MEMPAARLLLRKMRRSIEYSFTEDDPANASLGVAKVYVRGEGSWIWLDTSLRN